MHKMLARQLKRLGLTDRAPTAEEWATFLERVDRSYVEADQDRYTLERSLSLSSAEMRERLTELRLAQSQIAEASRKAGMADVATSVLHNVGNVLNSINVSAEIISSTLRTSGCERASKGMAMLRAQPQPGRFLDEDPRGKKLLVYLDGVANALGEERSIISHELDGLIRNIDHIKAIVATQLTAARSGGASVAARVDLKPLADDAVETLLRSKEQVCASHIRTELDPCAIVTDRHKVLQVVINLLSNAADAVAEVAEPQIRIRSHALPSGGAELTVSDNGVGIAAETLKKLFTHGFTTKANGHGFGLHACACAAIELGGQLAVKSDGLGKGATFTLTLPPVSPGAKGSGSQPKLRATHQPGTQP